MCEAKDRDVATCEVLVHALEKNGRCAYHEEITKGLSNVQGGFKMMLWALGFIFTIIIGMQSANLWFLFKHLGQTNVTKVEASQDYPARPDRATLQVSSRGLQDEMR